MWACFCVTFPSVALLARMLILMVAARCFFIIWHDNFQRVIDKEIISVAMHGVMEAVEINDYTCDGCTRACRMSATNA
jgi:hypothetical protein